MSLLLDEPEMRSELRTGSARVRADRIVVRTDGSVLLDPAPDEDKSPAAGSPVEAVLADVVGRRPARHPTCGFLR